MKKVVGNWTLAARDSRGELWMRFDEEKRAEAKAKAELAALTPPNVELLRTAERYPAPDEWLDEEDHNEKSAK